MQKLFSQRRLLNFEILAKGPKKKKGGGVAIPVSTDIVNVFKDRQDPQITTIYDYPEWVMKLAMDVHHPGVVMSAFQSQDETFYPDSIDIFQNRLKKNLFKKNNYQELYKKDENYDKIIKPYDHENYKSRKGTEELDKEELAELQKKEEEEDQAHLEAMEEEED